MSPICLLVPLPHGHVAVFGLHCCLLTGGFPAMKQEPFAVSLLVLSCWTACHTASSRQRSGNLDKHWLVPRQAFEGTVTSAPPSTHVYPSMPSCPWAVFTWLDHGSIGARLPLLVHGQA